MRDFLQRISSRKFLTALSVQIAVIASMIWRPEMEQQWSEAAMKVAELIVLLLVALGYAKIEAAVDASQGSKPDLTQSDRRY